MSLDVKNCEAVILAGGKSSRMGIDKSSLVNNSGTLMLDTLRSTLSLFERVLLSNNKEDGIKDIYKECGPLGGIHASLKECKKPYLFCIACDMPKMTKNAISYMFGSFDTSFDALICKDKTGKIHPTCCIIKRSLLPKIEEALENKECKLMQFFNSVNTKVLDMSIFPEDIFFNMNTPDDYRKYLHR